MSFLVSLDQEMKQNYTGNTIPVDVIAKSKNECVDRCTPERIIANEMNSKQWITIKVKIVVTKSTHLFHTWVTNPTNSNRDAYRKHRNSVTSMIRNAEREAIFEKLATNPCTWTIHRTLKNQTRNSQPCEMKVDINKSNEFFTSTGPKSPSRYRNHKMTGICHVLKQQCFHLIRVKMNMHESLRK